MLASPGYGERWGRHWLDLARDAESDRHGADRCRAEAWRCRDYVIGAVNDDKPYDRFILEQLAGDEIAPGDFQALTATGLPRHWIYENNQREIREVRAIISAHRAGDRQSPLAAAFRYRTRRDGQRFWPPW